MTHASCEAAYPRDLPGAADPLKSMRNAINKCETASIPGCNPLHGRFLRKAK